jgi:glyoxylase-like metal-dependent hydrolase (beta-lactamase superfamily II)
MRGQLCTLNTAVRALRIRGPSRQLRLLHQQAGNKPACTIRSQAPACPFKQHHPRHSLPRPANNHQGVANGRAAYTTEATVTGDPTVHGVFEPTTGTWQYVVADPATWSAVIIDPVLDFDSATQAVGTHAADSLLALATNRGYKVDRILETHMHADHLSAASYLQSRLAKEHGYRAPIGIGRRIGNLQKSFGQRYGVPAEEYDGVFDDLFEDDETFGIGKQTAMAIHLPGHTPDHLGYKIGSESAVPLSLVRAG